VTTTNTASSTRSANTYGTLTGGGTNPSVTATTGTRAMVIVTGLVSPEFGGSCQAWMSFSVDGPGGADQNASDSWAVERSAGSSTSTGDIQASTTTVLTNLTAGSNTFALQYRSSSSSCTSTYSNRSITVIPLG
jgi:hypothetical protein